MSQMQDEFKSIAIPVDVTVRFVETDLMGVVHHSAYIPWLEVGRIEWLTRIGMPYTEIAAGGHHFSVTGIDVQYRASTTFGDTVRVVTRLAKLRSRQVCFEYELFNAATDQLLATGRTDHICVDLAGRMAKIPQEVIDRIQKGAGEEVSGRKGEFAVNLPIA